MLRSLNDLTALEIEQLGNFMVSPFFNSRPKLISLFHYLKKKYPNISKLDISKETIFAEIYKDENYSDTKVRKLISDFTILFEKFLVHIEMAKIDGDYEKTILLEALQKRGMAKRYELNYREINKLLSEKFIKDDIYYRNIARIETLNSFGTYGNGTETETAKSLQNASDNIDFYFIFSKLHVFREMVIRRMISNEKFNFKMAFFED